MFANYKICVVSSSRADFGLLTPLLRALDASENFQLQFVATGSHLSHEHGFTIQEIETSGIKVDVQVDVSVDSASAIGIGETLARAASSFSKIFGELWPNLILILGDRYEMLGVASAATCLGIPIAHLHGGEITEGAIDDSIRHAITKLSHLHFVCNESYRNRVIQLGEHPTTVFNVGSLGIDNISCLKRLEKTDLEKQLHLKFSNRNIMVGYHSTTLEKNDATSVNIMLDDLAKLDDTTVIFTMPNADLGSKDVEHQFRDFSAEHNHAFFFENLGLLRYISCLAISDFLIGNSSSGILEAPFLGCYTINVGARQKGRLQADTVVNVTPKPNEIYEHVIELSKNIQSFGRPSPRQLFGDGKACERIVSILEKQIPTITTNKSFYDI